MHLFISYWLRDNVISYVIISCMFLITYKFTQALQKFLYLVNQDLEREKKGAIGIETLAKAIAEAPKIDNAHHDISDKLYYVSVISTVQIILILSFVCSTNNTYTDYMCSHI